MYRLFLLGIAVMTALSGCGPQAQPSAGAASQPPAQGAAADNAASQEAARPAEAAVKPPEPPASGQAEPDAAKPEAAKPAGAKPPEAGPSAGQAAPSDADAAQPPAASAAPPAEQTPPAPVAAAAPVHNALTVTITGDSKRGVLLKEGSVPYEEGMTVMDALKQATKQHKIQMEFQGKGAYAYVQGIDNLYEFDEGPKSGWVYKVNGSAPGEGAGAYKVKAGDKIEWLYTLDLGEDVGAKPK
ncbi:DUF4430 domain-containing protein [Paenibacillus sp. EPM92]|uniref:DUF4430 domain-containing protein n=1 Tax=Paenibacillus sp. EPM92 TaxID=1561195 RepID=UPI001915A566|nr:DUF4430 domain-containing protein [Paenibacillus sp. EPM92]